MELPVITNFYQNKEGTMPSFFMWLSIQAQVCTHALRILLAAGNNDAFCRGLLIKSDKIGSADFRLVGAEGCSGDERVAPQCQN